MNDVYVTSMGKFLPGEPVGNEEIEDYLGRINGKSSKAMRRILEQNKIRYRHYAIDKEQRSLYSNAEMAALAIRDALNRNSNADDNDIDFLAVGTTQGDLLVPGFASMVHAETGLPVMEIATHHGVCASGMQAMKNAFLQVLSGESRTAISCASEFPSRVFKHTRFEAQQAYRDSAVPFDTDFLRFMLSDGAGAAILQNSPAPSGLSLRIEWIDNKSYANSYDVCMYAGLNKDKGKDKGEDKDNRNHASWLDYRSVHDAADDGAVNLKQDIRLVNEMPKVGVDRFFELVEEGAVDPSAIDWMVCHYSSHFFRDEIFRLLKLGGLTIPEEKWFTNLYTKGNTGAASIYIMLEELLGSGKLSPGERVLCMVPESGRFQTSYMLMTVVGSRDESPRAPFEERAPEAPKLKYDSTNDIQAGLVRQLVRVWIDFEQKLSRVPVIHKLYQGKFTMNDYKSLMENIRQQVIDGSQWIARAASYIPIEHIDLRSTFIAHARDEHRDFQILERNYVSVGGDLAAIQAGEKNIGSEALSAYLFQRASRDNPVDLIGAMWIIEGLGCRMARYWGEMIRDQLGLDDEQVSFLLYHSDSDELHFERLETVVQHPLLTADIAARIVKTAKTTARLYLLQLEELNHV